MRVSAVLRSTMEVRAGDFEIGTLLRRWSGLALFHCSVFLQGSALRRLHSLHDGLLHLLARPDGDADAAIAAWIVGAIANKHARSTHEAHKLAHAGPMSTRMKLARLGQRRRPAASSGFEIPRAPRALRRHTNRDTLCLQARGQAGEGERVDAVRRKTRRIQRMDSTGPASRPRRRPARP
jgi:hypothetical protein